MSKTNTLAQVAALVEQAEAIKADLSTPAKSASAPKPMTLTKARLGVLKDRGFIPRGTSRAQALAGVDGTGAPLSDEAKSIIATFVPPTGAMKAHLHDLKESGTPRTVKVAEAPEFSPEVQAKIDALTKGGSFTKAEALQILGL